MCATGGLRFGDEEEFAEEIARAETFVPEEGCRPRVYYLNLPHLFIAGDVWDPSENEIIEGATVTLTMPDGSVRETETDDFGDFYFRRIDEGVYGVKIEVDGFRPFEKLGIDVRESLNLGDFPLEKA